MARAFKVRKVTVGGRKEPRYAARLEDSERALVAGLMHQVAELIDVPEQPALPADHTGEGDSFEDIVGRLGMSVGPEAAPDPSRPGEEGTRGARPEHVAGYEDPAVRRLFPIANRADPEAAEEFARLSEVGLRRRKRDTLLQAATLLEQTDHLELRPAQAQVLLVALTDVRVVLGERMGLRSDDDAAAMEFVARDLDEEDPRLHYIMVYDFLTWLQESLALALLKGVPESGTRDE